MRALVAVLVLMPLAACDSTVPAESEVGDLVVTAEGDGFLLQTEDDFPCSNIPLAVDVDASSDRMEIEVEGTGEVEVCLTALGPATTFVPFPDDQDTIGYRVSVRKDGLTDQYRYDCGFGGCFLSAVGEPSFTRVGPR